MSGGKVMFRFSCSIVLSKVEEMYSDTHFSECVPRRVAVPTHRFTPLKEKWMDLYQVWFCGGEEGGHTHTPRAPQLKKSRTQARFMEKCLQECFQGVPPKVLPAASAAGEAALLQTAQTLCGGLLQPAKRAASRQSRCRENLQSWPTPISIPQAALRCRAKRRAGPHEQCRDGRCRISTAPPSKHLRRFCLEHPRPTGTRSRTACTPGHRRQRRQLEIRARAWQRQDKTCMAGRRRRHPAQLLRRGRTTGSMAGG
jgi:hypothetical protein